MRLVRLPLIGCIIVFILIVFFLFVVVSVISVSVVLLCDRNVPEWCIPDDYYFGGCVELLLICELLYPCIWVSYQVCLGLCVDQPPLTPPSNAPQRSVSVSRQ